MGEMMTLILLKIQFVVLRHRTSFKMLPYKRSFIKCRLNQITQREDTNQKLQRFQDLKLKGRFDTL